jgi:hypothetical protein
MSQTLRTAAGRSTHDGLGRSFSRLGWAGFWLQLVFGSLPILVMAYYFAGSGTGTLSRSGLPFVEYLTIANLLLLVFTTLWSFRYTRLGRRLRDPQRRLPESSVLGVVWTGVAASTVGLLVSMLVMLIEAASLLYFFLKAPQGGIPVVQTAAAGQAYFVSTVDMVSLMALMLTLFAQMIVQALSLWLLFRTTRGFLEIPKTGEEADRAGEVQPTPAPPPSDGASPP